MHGLVPDLAAIDKARLHYNKGHSLHITRKDKCKMLADARRGVWRALEADPKKYGKPDNWKLPARPDDTSPIGMRQRGEGVVVLEGHLAGNRNPDHEHGLFT